MKYIDVNTYNCWVQAQASRFTYFLSPDPSVGLRCIDSCQQANSGTIQHDTVTMNPVTITSCSSIQNFPLLAASAGSLTKCFHVLMSTMSRYHLHLCSQCCTHNWLSMTTSSRSSEQGWNPKWVGGIQYLAGGFGSCRRQTQPSHIGCQFTLSHPIAIPFSAQSNSAARVLRIISALDFLLLLWIYSGLILHSEACKGK